MNHFSNYITPTSVFLVSLTNTITANRGIASLGVKLTLGSFWECWEQLPAPWKSQKEKTGRPGARGGSWAPVLGKWTQSIPCIVLQLEDV